MKWVDLAIAGLFPKFAMKRMQARQGIKAFYEAAKVSQYHKTRNVTGSPDDETKGASDKLRIQARHLEQNHDIARGVLDVLVDNTVGLGIRPAPMVMNAAGELDRDVNDQLLKLWKDWVKVPEVTHEHSYYGLQRIMARSWYRDGEVLSQFLEGTSRGLDHGTVVPFSLEPLEADYLPSDMDDEGKGIIQGVKKNQWGRPTQYFIFKKFPTGFVYSNTSETKRVNADRMLHLKFVDRLKQTRGVSVFASVINRLDDIKEIEESERVAARVAAAMTGFIKKGSPDMYVAPDAGEDTREMEFNPGMIFDNLQLGEEVGTISSNRPNNELIPFRDSQLKAAAAGTGSSYSSISRNYDGTYSSQRQELSESYVHYGILWSAFTERFCTPVWERFVRAAVTAKLVELPAGVDMDTLYDVSHSRPAMVTVDPAKEMSGIRDELDLRISSLSQIQRRRGNDPDEVRAEIVREREMDEEAGLAPNMEEGDPDDPENPDDPPPEDEESEDEDETGDKDDDKKAQVNKRKRSRKRKRKSHK